MKSNVLMYVVCIFSVCSVFTNPAGAEQLAFQRAIQLALVHSNEMALADADVMRATQSYQEAHDTYIPQLAVGSNIGYAYGFPLSLEGSAPTLFNVTTQASVWNPAQREFVRAAKADWRAAKSQSRDQRAQVIRETALTYIQLDKWEEKLVVLRDEEKVSRDIEYAVRQRIEEGIDSPIEQTKAKLTDAQTRVHIAETEGAIDTLHTRLSQLTGLPASSIETVRQSIPVLMENNPEDDVAAVAIQSSAAVESAEELATAKRLRARGEHKVLYPTADFAAQYGLINTSLTNFEQFFVPHSFQPHNVTFGLVLRFPLFSATQRARAASADAEAVRALKEAEQTKDRAALNTSKLNHDVRQLSAMRDVAQLRYELAEAQLDAIHIRMQAETATLRELQSAAIDAAERTMERINTELALQQAQLELLRATGKLERWALSHK